MNPILARWNTAPAEQAAGEILSCCGSYAWAQQMTAMRPFVDPQTLFTAAEQCWRALAEDDWQQAFRAHPRIGEQQAQQHTTPASAAWSKSEQSPMENAEAALVTRMQEGQRQYEQRFGRIFIVCASDKQPAELLRILEHRLNNNPERELLESAVQQQEITQLRLRKWLNAV